MLAVDTNWIDSNSIKKILRAAQRDASIEVSNVEVNAANLNRSRYGSEIRRVIMNLTKIRDNREMTEEFSMIYKIVISSGPLARMLIGAGIWENEIAMMTDTLPKMQTILESLNVPCNLSPRLFYSECKTPMYLVMEDLARRNFRSYEKTEFDLEHCLLAIRNLAKFHASSVAVKEKEPNAFESFKRGTYHKSHSSDLNVIFVRSMGTFSKVIKDWTELEPKIIEKVSKLVDVIYEKACESSVTYEDEFNVLLHGDFWKNNILFRYDDDGKPNDLVFVDFQLSFYGSPALDLLNLLSTSAPSWVRENHRNLLLREYHFALTNTMSILQCTTTPPSFEVFKNDVDRRFWMEVIPFFTLWPTFVNDDVVSEAMSETWTFDGGFDDIPQMRSPLFRRVATKMLLELDNRGLLEE